MKNESEPRLALPTLRVLHMFVEMPSKQFAGADVSRATGLASGTLYPILVRLEKAGWLESEWEEILPKEAGRPRRRYYRITDKGLSKSIEAFGQLVGVQEVRSWA